MAAIVLFVAAGALVGVANNTSQHWLGAVAVVLFALGAVAFLRWRNAARARVLDHEEKTSSNDP